MSKAPTVKAAGFGPAIFACGLNFGRIRRYEVGSFQRRPTKVSPTMRLPTGPRCWPPKKGVRMTPAGREVYARSMAAIRPKVEKLRDGFTQKEFREALPFLRALRIWMTEQA